MGFWKRLKDKISFGIIFYGALTFVIVITTLFPVIFDFEHANYKEIIGNTILAIIIVLLCFSYQTNATRKRMTKEDSDWAKSKNNFINGIKEIQDNSLSKMHSLYVEDANEKIKQDYIKSVLAKYEIEDNFMTCETKIIKIAYDEGSITKYQKKIIEKLRKGNYELDEYDVRDLTTTFILKDYRNTNKSQQSEIIASELMSKVLLMCIGSFLLGTLSPDAMTNGISAQSWINLACRLMQLCGGILCGVGCGDKLVKDEIRLYDKFYNFNSSFLQEFRNKTWQPKEEKVKKSIVDDILAREEKKLEKVEVVEMTQEDFDKLKTLKIETNMQQN